MNNNSRSELFKLTEAERIQLAQDLWDSISPESEALRLADEELQEIKRRLVAHEEDPGSAIPWDEARERLRERFGA